MSKEKFTEQAFAFLVDERGFSCDATTEDGQGFGAVTIYRRGLDVVRIGADSDWRDPEYSVVVNGKKVFSLYRDWCVPFATDARCGCQSHRVAVTPLRYAQAILAATVSGLSVSMRC